jgi:hypothetical protein
MDLAKAFPARVDDGDVTVISSSPGLAINWRPGRIGAVESLVRDRSSAVKRPRAERVGDCSATQHSLPIVRSVRCLLGALESRRETQPGNVGRQCQTACSLASRCHEDTVTLARPGRRALSRPCAERRGGLLLPSRRSGWPVVGAPEASVIASLGVVEVAVEAKIPPAAFAPPCDQALDGGGIEPPARGAVF